MTLSPLLDVENLTVSYQTPRGKVHAVTNVSFQVSAGETFALVGESGCGKSSLGRAVIRLQDAQHGAINLNGVNVAALKGRDLHPYRRQMQIIFQDPAASLDPRFRISRLIGEPLQQDPRLDRRARLERVHALMETVGLRPELIDRLPHELSGGQRQRVAIARAIALSPQLVICDEPVSALDVSLQAQVLNLLADLQQQKGIAYLFISHDLSVVQYIAQRVAVMYLGEIVEIANRDELWGQPSHPYTAALLNAVPRLQPNTHRIGAKQVLSGDLPSPFSPPSGCRFHTRCPLAMERCRTEAPELRSKSATHSVACHLAE